MGKFEGCGGLDKKVGVFTLGVFRGWFVFWKNWGWLLKAVAAKISDELVHIWRVCFVKPLGELYGLVIVRIAFDCLFRPFEVSLKIVSLKVFQHQEVQ